MPYTASAKLHTHLSPIIFPTAIHLLSIAPLTDRLCKATETKWFTLKNLRAISFVIPITLAVSTKFRGPQASGLYEQHTLCHHAGQRKALLPGKVSTSKCYPVLVQ